MGRLEAGKPVPRHHLSGLLATSMGDKTLLHCDWKSRLELWEFVSKIACVRSIGKVAEK